MTKIIMTHHAVERRLQRRISMGMIKQTVNKPDGSKRESDGDTQFYKTINGRKIHAVAHPQRGGDWLIKTVWVDNENDPHPLWKLIVQLAVSLFRRN